MSDLYHISPVMLRPGSIIEPGNWGRVEGLIAAQNGVAPPYNVAVECAFEYARKLIAPDAPSRLMCVFACPTLAGACHFRDAQRATELIYEVEIVEPGTPVHAAHWQNVPLGGSGFEAGRSILAQMDALVSAYWEEGKSDPTELLIGGPIRILALAG